METLLDFLLEGDFDKAKQQILEQLSSVTQQKLFERKKQMAAKVEHKNEIKALEADIAAKEMSDDNYYSSGRRDRDKMKLWQLRQAQKVHEETEEQSLDEARIKIVRARIRNGKVQRRKKVSTVKGYTFRRGKLTRMSPMERRRRKMGQRRGKIKRRSKISRTLMKRKRSLRKRKSMGIR